MNEAKCGCAVPDGYPHECDGRRSGPLRPVVDSMLPQVRRVWGFESMDKSIDDQPIRDAREEGESRERIRIRGLIQELYAEWANEPHNFVAYGAKSALSHALNRIDGTLPGPHDAARNGGQPRHEAARDQ